MSRLHLHPENHLVARIGWLRAAVRGANDGIVSTASLIVGVAAAAATHNDVLIGVAGAMSMAAGEYVSVSPQSDTEQADLARERKELSKNVEFEQEELAEIYVKRAPNGPIGRSGRSGSTTTVAPASIKGVGLRIITGTFIAQAILDDTFSRKFSTRRRRRQRERQS